MNEIMKLFEFKSKQPFYNKEKSGIKSNTIREIDLNDARFLHLIYWMIHGWKGGEIRIQINDATGKHNFIRPIIDISVYNDIMIISW